MRIDLNLIRFKTTKGYVLQISSLRFHQHHPYTLVRELNWSHENKWAYEICREHNSHKDDVEYQDALLRAYGLTDKKP
jgi:hypothetical protein